MKQTAVQWYADKQESLQGIFSLGGITATEYYEKLCDLVKEAMELEKEQIMKSNRDGVDMCLDKKPFVTAEEYYNKNYGRENN